MNIWFKYGFLLVLFASADLAKAQQYNVRFDPYLNQVGQKLGQYLEEFESFGVKASGSQGLEQTFQWLKETYNSFGYTEIETDSFLYAGQWNKNLIINKLSANKDAPYLVVISHYDTRNGPGANDNGSGVATTLEIARIVQPLTSTYNLRFIHFAAEENGLIGSEHYVENTLEKNDSILCVFNLDQLGGTTGQGEDNYKIYCERDENDIPSTNNAYSNALTAKLKLFMELYSSVEGVIGPAFRSDYIPFEQEGYVITGLYQYSSSPFTHTIRDSIVYMDTQATKEICKGALSFVLEMLQNEETVSINSTISRDISVFPNPARSIVYVEVEDKAQVKYQIIHTAGLICQQGILKQNEIDVRPLTNGVYLLRLNFQDGTTLVRKIAVEN